MYSIHIFASYFLPNTFHNCVCVAVQLFKHPITETDWLLHRFLARCERFNFSRIHKFTCTVFRVRDFPNREKRTSERNSFDECSQTYKMVNKNGGKPPSMSVSQHCTCNYISIGMWAQTADWQSPSHRNWLRANPVHALSGWSRYWLRNELVPRQTGQRFRRFARQPLVGQDECVRAHGAQSTSG